MFDFGKNWEEFSARALDESAVLAAEKSLGELLGADALRGRSFLDVGAGTGLFSIAAARLGARTVTGIDVDPKCVEVARRNAARFLDNSALVNFDQVSILDRGRVESMPLSDFVYAWGSLHHTGKMFEAIKIAAGRVATGGRLVLAIYNRHFTSPLWKLIKRFYNASPGFIRFFMVYFFAAIIFAAKFMVTRRNPLKKQRGMNFFYDLVDWVGGYPYEYAAAIEIAGFVENLGFKNVATTPAEVPTGCNEFVFERLDAR